MILKRNNIIKQYPWIKNKKQKFIVSADYDGLICASFLNHYLNWELAGYYNLESIWISNSAIKSKEDLIWVDLNILPRQGRSIGGHIISIEGESHTGFETSCNPNIIANLTSNNFNRKFPFSTILFLMWLNNIQVKKDDWELFLILHSDATWVKMQHYTDNVKQWMASLSNYDFDKLVNRSRSKTFEKKIDQIFYPKLIEIGAISGFSKLTGKVNNIKSRESKINPDWDEDIILRLFNLFGQKLGWTPPQLPVIINRVDGERHRMKLSKVRDVGIKTFLKKNKVFSYTITSPKYLNFTSFGLTYKSPMTN